VNKVNLQIVRHLSSWRRVFNSNCAIFFITSFWSDILLLVTGQMLNV